MGTFRSNKVFSITVFTIHQKQLFIEVSLFLYLLSPQTIVVARVVASVVNLMNGEFVLPLLLLIELSIETALSRMAVHRSVFLHRFRSLHLPWIIRWVASQTNGSLVEFVETWDQNGSRAKLGPHQSIRNHQLIWWNTIRLQYFELQQKLFYCRFLQYPWY